jgi:hypothetical protein
MNAGIVGSVRSGLGKGRREIPYFFLARPAFDCGVLYIEPAPAVGSMSRRTNLLPREHCRGENRDPKKPLSDTLRISIFKARRRASAAFIRHSHGTSKGAGRCAQHPGSASAPAPA